MGPGRTEGGGRWGVGVARGGPGTERAGPQEVPSSRKRPPATNYNSQHPPQLPVGKMVARRRKRAVRESDSGVPTLPGYSGEGMRVARPGAAILLHEEPGGSAVAQDPEEPSHAWT